jgi:acetyltransferase-like isoleucine patch superfamily enzyme
VKKLLMNILDKLVWKLSTYTGHPKTIFPHKSVAMGTLTVGENSSLGQGVVIDCTGDVRIGKNTIIGADTQIFTHSHVLYEGVCEDIINEKRIRVQPLEIGDNVVMAMEIMILGQVEHIGDNAIIGARSLLTKNVGPSEIWAGNPARKVGVRDPAKTVPLDCADDDIR